MQKTSLIISTLLAAALGCSSAYAVTHDESTTIESANAVQGGGSGGASMADVR